MLFSRQLWIPPIFVHHLVSFSELKALSSTVVVSVVNVSRDDENKTVRLLHQVS